MSSPLAAAVLAFGLALAFVRLLASDQLARLVLDVPNERSLHARPTPRTGGIGLMLAAGLAWGMSTPSAARLAAEPWAALLHFAVVPLAGILAAVFLVDDVRGLPVAMRLAAQAAVAALFVWLTGPYALWLAPLLVVGIVWSANLYNFMDGSNGLAGGMAVAGFGAYALAAHHAGAPEFALAAAIVAGAAAGFLVWNFDPARIFLGDAGSIPLGFLAAAIGILGWRRGIWPFWLPALVFSPFVVDACLTLVHRWRRGERLSNAHRSHYYQRLVRMGWSHRRLALTAYGLMLAAGTAALALRTAGPVVVALSLAAWVVIYAALAVLVDRRWRATGEGGAARR